MLQRFIDNWDLCLFCFVIGVILSTCAKALAMWLVTTNGQHEYEQDKVEDF